MNEQLRAIIADTLALETTDVTPELGRDSDAADWDSLGHLRLVTAVEEAFGIRMTMNEIEGITTAGQLNDCVTSHTANQ